MSSDNIDFVSNDRFPDYPLDAKYVSERGMLFFRNLSDSKVYEFQATVFETTIAANHLIPNRNDWTHLGNLAPTNGKRYTVYVKIVDVARVLNKDSITLYRETKEKPELVLAQIIDIVYHTKIIEMKVKEKELISRIQDVHQAMLDKILPKITDPEMRLPFYELTMYTLLGWSSGGTAVIDPENPSNTPEQILGQKGLFEQFLRGKTIKILEEVKKWPDSQFKIDIIDGIEDMGIIKEKSD